MKKFKVTVTRTDEFEVEIDENIWNEEALETWSQSFWDISDAEELAETIASTISKMGSGHGFFEGFGNLKIFSNGEQKKVFSGKEHLALPDEEYTKGILVNVIQEDFDYECDTSEM